MERSMPIFFRRISMVETALTLEALSPLFQIEYQTVSKKRRIQLKKVVLRYN